MPKTGNKNTDSNTVPTLAAYIAAQIANKRAAALDKSRNRTSVKVPMIPNTISEDIWRDRLTKNIKSSEKFLSKAMAEGNTHSANFWKKDLDYLLKQEELGYPVMVEGANCMYNAGDCYGLNVPGNLTFAAKHRKLGFQKAPKGSMEPGDIVQDVSSGKPIHAMIYDSKDSEGNLLFNYARGNTGEDAFDINKNYRKQAKYILPIKDYDVYKFVGTPADSTQWINEYKQKYGNGMRCGGRRKAQLGLDIREGGIAIPIAPNMYYMNGRSHDEGGIGIGPNNKNGLEVEGGEVVKVGDNDIKVFSSVPLLRGVSPAQLVMGGANPNKVFKAQEEFKDRNHINDDGTHYQTGGQKIYTPDESIQRQIQETGRITIGGAPTIGGLRTYGYLKGLSNVRKYGQNVNNLFTKSYNFLNRKLQNLINKNKISVDTAQKYNSAYREFVGETGQNIPKTISLMQDDDIKKAGGIYIKPSKRGTFTAAATKHGMGVQEFASKVLANKEDYSPAMIKKANFARNANRWKKEYGGNMIYTVNGNVKNGLMSARPKAQYGKVDRKNKDVKVGSDGLIYKRAADGEWYTDGTKHVTVKPVKESNAINQGSAKAANKSKLKTLPVSRTYLEWNNDEEEKETKKIGSLTYEKNENGQWVPSSNQSITTTRSGGRPESFGMTRIGVNHPSGKYKYNPMTGERLTEDGAVETYEPSVKGTTKVSSRTASTSRRGGTKAATSKTTIELTPTLQDTINQITRDAIYRSNTPKIDLSKVKMPTYDVSQLGNKESKTYKANIPKSGRWIGQYKSTNVGDWIGLGSNLAGTVASYFMTKNAINKTPDPIKPIMAQAAKLKTRYNVEPQLTNIRESEQMNRAAVRRNTQSSNTSLAREQRLMNEARGARNVLYSQKENIETQLINQDRLNRQSVMRDNVRAYNEYLNRLTAARQGQNQLRISNINNLLSGLTGSVNNILGTIESRRATNNTLRAIAAANPNVDARLIGGFDYYIDPITKRKYNKNQQYVRTING